MRRRATTESFNFAETEASNVEESNKLSYYLLNKPPYTNSYHQIQGSKNKEGNQKLDSILKSVIRYSFTGSFERALELCHTAVHNVSFQGIIFTNSTRDSHFWGTILGFRGQKCVGCEEFRPREIKLIRKSLSNYI